MFSGYSLLEIISRDHVFIKTPKPGLMQVRNKKNITKVFQLGIVKWYANDPLSLTVFFFKNISNQKIIKKKLFHNVFL